METSAIIIKAPKSVEFATVSLVAPKPDEVVVDVLWSGVSTGTERLLWSGRMPSFPGMGYPLVPGYESVGRVVAAGEDTDLQEGDLVFAPGARCYADVRPVFGGSAARIIISAARTTQLSAEVGVEGVLLALAATAHHAVVGGEAPDLIVGHGALGRLIARITLALGAPAPVVWEIAEHRMDAGCGYAVLSPDADGRHDYRSICDVSGAGKILDDLIGRLAPKGEVTLAGFYGEPLTFAFPPAFMREARLRVAAEWAPEDMTAVVRLVDDGLLSLDGLLTHQAPAADAAQRYATAFEDPSCLKLALDWRAYHDAAA